MEELGITKLVIFDLDGTLIDSARQILLAVNYTRQELKLPTAERNFLRSKIGLPAKELFADLNLKESESEKAVAIFRNYLWTLKLVPRDVFSDGHELLSSLKKKGLQLAVATNKPSDLAKHALEGTRLLQFFDLVVGSENLPPKPNPDMIIKCFSTFKLNSSQAVMIGDRTEDMLAASSARVLAFGVLQGFHTKMELENSGAGCVFQSISDLSERVRNGWNFENLQ